MVWPCGTHGREGNVFRILLGKPKRENEEVRSSGTDSTHQWLPLQFAKITPEDGSELRPKHVEL